MSVAVVLGSFFTTPNQCFLYTCSLSVTQYMSGILPWTFQKIVLAVASVCAIPVIDFLSSPGFSFPPRGSSLVFLLIFLAKFTLQPAFFPCFNNQCNKTHLPDTCPNTLAHQKCDALLQMTLKSSQRIRSRRKRGNEDLVSQMFSGKNKGIGLTVSPLLKGCV